MALHRLNQITVGVPDVITTGAYYRDFGLTEAPSDAAGQRALAFATVDGGEQLRIVPSDHRKLLELRIGADGPDDIDRIARSLAHLEIPSERSTDSIRAVDSGTELAVIVEVAPRMSQTPTPTPAYNAPGVPARADSRAPGIERDEAVKPRKLGHVVIGSTDQPGSQRFFGDGLGLKVSDQVPGLAAFMRCSTDHHNVLVQKAPVAFLHHTAWEVDDVDEVGRGATAMLEGHPERHVWGLGRHHVGSNFFWYLRDPAGNFSEYYSDLDCIVDDALWKPGVFEGMRGLYNWGPSVPPSFLAPEDLADLMTQEHGPR
ncbi:VOC family protein [Mycobacterium sp. 21AC1]|uniref:VOC family protein n=1 Tax=[Mycobacterium] appelbergii TaxID=2939269 RepID=UPI002938DB08|nr:VOC family protein [Mycobacterium sp. 21AC1]MDV3129927.1 VOC family protein [Mycobacterium sp. 21AC1]